MTAKLAKCAIKSCTNFVKRKGKKFCSSKCYHISRSNTKENIKCMGCGIEFSGIPGKSRYHSLGCFNSATKSRERVKKECLNCGVEFKVIPSRKDKALFHSYECFIDYERKGLGATVEISCENCGKKRTVPYHHRFRRFCGYSCANTGQYNGMFQKGHLCSWYGKHAWNYGQTTKTDKRIFDLGQKISAITKEQFRLGIRSNNGSNNPNWGYTPADRTPEQKERYSKAAVARMLSGVILLGYQRGYHTSTKTGDTMFYRSSYELRFMKCLDASPDVATYVYEPFSLKVRDGKRYVPDFVVHYVDGEECLLEVKPTCFVNDVSVQEKAEAAKEYCSAHNMTFHFITLEDIETLEEQLHVIS